ncbi:MAG: riboflavin synthase [Magnetovibrio sp.]|nr:riboflavin synthase [Magnetovibrio sp.]
MFTGIVTDIGRVRSTFATGDGAGEGRRFEIETIYPLGTVDIGASISCSGACMTVVDKDDTAFTVEVSAESLSKTTLGVWESGTRMNLERSMCLGDELGGHMVSGHVDGVATLVGLAPDGDSLRLTFSGPGFLTKFIAPKGSVTLDGVSLTVNEVVEKEFTVNIIAHTQNTTTLSTLGVGGKVNLEIDMLARYIARLLAQD